VRLAIPASAAATGLLLLGLAIFGRPDVYLHQARQQWVGLLDGTSDAEDAGQGGGAPEKTAAADVGDEALALRVAQLQQQVIQLRDQLAASKFHVDQAPQLVAPSPYQPANAQPPPPQLASSSPIAPAAGIPASIAPPAIAPPANPAPAVAPQSAIPRSPPVAVPPDRIETTGQPNVIPEHREAARPPPPPAATRQRPDAAAVRVEPDDMQSVLARLRQRPNTATPPAIGPPTTEQPNPNPNPVSAPSPARQRLEVARTALLEGRVDEARRILQEVQLRLVFRPVSPGNDDPPSAGQGATDVAHALEALGGADTRRSIQFIERAMDDVYATNASSHPPR
jgi:hypothetical protein